jgi:hypothetical protein
MNTPRLALAAVVLGVLVCAAQRPAQAHHAFSAEYDARQPIKLEGTIVKMEWVNPHGWLHIDVKEPNGTMTQWALEFGSPNQLYRRGWRKEDLPVGALVTVEGFRARDGSPTANARNVVLTNGRRLFAGSPDGAPDGPRASEN